MFGQNTLKKDIQNSFAQQTHLRGSYGHTDVNVVSIDNITTFNHCAKRCVHIITTYIQRLKEMYVHSQ